MKISFLKNGYIALGEDLSYIEPTTVDGITDPGRGRADCIFCHDIEFDQKTQTIEFDPVTEEIKIDYIPGIDRSRVFQSLKTGSNDLK